VADNKLALAAVVVILVIVAGAWWYFSQPAPTPEVPEQPTQPTTPGGETGTGETGEGTTPSEPSVSFAGQLVILRDDSPKSLDPTKTTWTNDYGIMANIYSNLVSYERGTRNLVPDLAESWEVSDDGLVYTFHLRKGVKWHKGWGEFTAWDVKFTIDRILNPNVSVIYRSLFSSVESVEVVDDYTVKITLKNPDPAFLYVLAPYRNGFIVCKAYYESLDDPETQYGKNPVGTGPYEFVYWNEETGEVKLTAFEDYYAWPSGSHVKDIIYKPIEDDDLRFNAFIGGEADVYTMPDPEKLAYLKDMESRGEVTILIETGTGMNSLIFDTERDLYLKDLRIRKAIAHAVNKTYIVKEILGDTVIEAVGWLPVGGYLYATNDVPQYPYDLDTAQALVNEFKADTGYDTITIEFYLPQAFPYVEIAEYVQSQLAKIGITVNLHVLDFSSWYDACVVQGITNMTYLPLGGRPPEPSVIMKTVFSVNSIPPGGINFARYKEVDPLINQAVVTTDEAARGELYKQIQVKLMEDLPLYPLYYYKVIVVTKPNVKNFTVDNFNSYGDWMEYVYIEGASAASAPAQVITSIISSFTLLAPLAVPTVSPSIETRFIRVPN